MMFFADTDISGCAVNQMKKFDNYAFWLKFSPAGCIFQKLSQIAKF